MSYLYTVGLKVIVEEVLTALTETPTVYAYDFLTGDALTSPAPTITSVRTGVYRLSVTANVLTDVLFVFIPHQDDEDKIGQEALMHEKMYHVVDELANGVTLADGAIGDRFEVFISGKYPDIVVSGAGTVGIDGVYEYRYMRNGKPRYCLVLDGEDTEMQLLWDTHKWGIQFGESYTGFYYSNSDVPTPDLATDWWGYAGDSPMPEVTTALDTSLYAQLETIRGAGWTDESLKAIAEAIDAIDGGLDAAGVRSAIGLASANLDTQLSGIKTDTNNVTTRLTATRAGYIDKLNVAGNLANTTNAGDFKADVSGLAKTTDLSGLATSSALSTVDGKVDGIKARTDNLPNSPAATGDAMTLTMTPAEILSYIQQTAITQTRGNSWNIGIEDVSLPAAKQQIAIKQNHAQKDSQALLFIDTAGDLLVINGKVLDDHSGASLTYAGGTLTLKLDPEITARFKPGTYIYGIQGIASNGSAVEPYGGVFTIVPDVVRRAK